MKRAVYAGSFDPITNGHLWMVREGAKLFDKLVVSVGVNPDKKGMFTLDERIDMLKRATRAIPNVVVDSFENKYLVKYADSIDAGYVLRGIRSDNDFEFERTLRHLNSDLNPDVSSIFLMPPREISEVSSSIVKGLIGPDEWEEVVGTFVPVGVYNRFLQKFKGYSNRWCALWERLGRDPGDAYSDLLDRYAEPHRSYHNFAHIAHCLQEFDKASHLAAEPEAVELAIWFHDAVYDTQAKGNEENSAELAFNTLRKAGASGDFSRTVSELVLATKHDAEVDGDAGLLVDVDLSILGQPEDVYDVYERDIKEEYAWVPDDQFKAGRKAILQSFLDRDSIYSTGFFKDKYESQSGKNLERALKNL